jgi:Uma2 family endonuclease
MSPTTEQLPPLLPGDRLTRTEFERRYEAMPNFKRAELIEGVVSIPSPVGIIRGNSPHFHLVGWIGPYEAATPGLEGGSYATIRLDETNETQPHVVLITDQERGGQARIGDDDFIEGPPEFVAEICPSGVSFDLHTKLEVYRRNGVLEYLVWRVLDEKFDWFVLRDGAFLALTEDASGLLKSQVFPGLWLDAAALVRDDMPHVLDVVRQGIASSEHASFAERLAK